MLTLFAGCGEECVTEPSGSKTAAVFPLAVGNKWIYDDPAESDSVTATIVLDDETYYVLEGLFREPINVRMNDQNQLVVRWDHESCGECVLFDFDASVGEKWPFVIPCSDTFPPEIMTLRRQLDSLTVPAGTYRDCLEFAWVPYITDAGMSWTVAPGIGVVRSFLYTYGGSETYKLVEFIEASR